MKFSQLLVPLLAVASSSVQAADSSPVDWLSFLTKIAASVSPDTPAFVPKNVVNNVVNSNELPQFVDAPKPIEQTKPSNKDSKIVDVLPQFVDVNATSVARVVPSAVPSSEVAPPAPVVTSVVVVSSAVDEPAPSPSPSPSVVELVPVTTEEVVIQRPPPPARPNTVGNLIGSSAFYKALSACGISKPGLYEALTTGFTAPLNGGLKELALLIGNTAHESGSYKFTEEINCKGVTEVTDHCQYGWYHGRGYIQISWEDNYRKAAEALGNPKILETPDIVMWDESVNWATVQWYWTSTVQPFLHEHGYTLGNSVKSINGYLECGGNPISPQRVKFIQCFEDQFTGSSTASADAWC
ncbi:UNVERIFIED_CONTAM: Chitinase 1 [Siphonaria sp. JEL0065]|nr:Chitinase 1 [Siphonaria sp. JEL0065]